MHLSKAIPEPIMVTGAAVDKLIRIRATDSKLDELKLGAVLRAIYHAAENESALGEFVHCINEPCSTASGDLYWGRRTKKAAAIVVGDTSGHNAYAALLSAMIGMKLNEIWPRYAAMLNTRNGTKNSGQIAQKLAKELAGLFQSVMEKASDILQQLSKERKRSILISHAVRAIRNDGYVSAICILTADSIDLISMGLPIFVVANNGRVSVCGEYSDAKSIDLRRRGHRFPDPIRIDPNCRYLVIATDGVVNEGLSRTRPEFGNNGIKRVIEKMHEYAAPARIAESVLIAAKRYRGPKPVTDDRLVAAIDFGLWRKSLK